VAAAAANGILDAAAAARIFGTAPGSVVSRAAAGFPSRAPWSQAVSLPVAQLQAAVLRPTVHAALFTPAARLALAAAIKQGATVIGAAAGVAIAAAAAVLLAPAVIAAAGVAA